MITEEEAKRKLLVKNLALEKAELEKDRLEAEQIARKEKTLRLEQEMILKNKELTTTALLVNQHQEVLNQLKKQLETFKDSANQPTLKQAQQLIRNNLSITEDWGQFKNHFDQVHPDFFQKLSEQFPNLSQNDIRHCAYIRMRMSTKEIARMFNIAATSVQISRVRMKKKMKLGKETDLRTFILSF